MPVGSTEALVAQCRAQLDAGLVDEALAALTRTYHGAAGTGRWSLAAWAANWIGHVHEHHLGDWEPALFWFARAEQAAAASAVDLPHTRAMARYNAGLVEARRGRTTAALGHFEAAQKAAGVSGDDGLDATCTERVGAALAELGRWDDGLIELDRAEWLATGAGDPALASSCAEQAAEIVTALEWPPAAQFDRLARAGLDRTLAAAGWRPPSRILDAGCGAGDELRMVAERWPSAGVVGIDRPEIVRSIRLPRHLRRRVEVCGIDLTVSKPDPGGFDLVVCNAVLHTVAAPRAFLAIVARALRPGGVLVGATFTDAYHRRLRDRLFAAGVPLARPTISHTEDAIITALTAAGFTTIDTWTEAVELHAEGPNAIAHLERVLGRTLDAGEADRLLDATGRRLCLDLSPLSFRALAR
jgi:malonyl-CoA O-methyltransferase